VVPFNKGEAYAYGDCEIFTLAVLATGIPAGITTASLLTIKAINYITLLI
jgi:hypothetical protein